MPSAASIFVFKLCMTVIVESESTSLPVTRMHMVEETSTFQSIEELKYILSSKLRFLQEFLALTKPYKIKIISFDASLAFRTALSIGVNRYLSCSLLSLVRYRVEHEKRNSISTRKSVLFFVCSFNVCITFL